MQTIDELLSQGVTGRPVLVRADLNVPLDMSGDVTHAAPVISDDGRIRASLTTIKALLDARARVVVTAHLGRPKGTVDPAFSLAPVAARLGELLDTPVALAGDVVGPSARSVVSALGDGEVALLENVRFDPRETSKDDAERGALADDLAALVGPSAAFVSDGFGVVHRLQASVVDVARRMPHYAGYLVTAETTVLRHLTGTPDRPYVVALGGAKVSDKLGVITALLDSVDTLLIGGGMGYTFLAAQGHPVGDSLLQADQIDTCRELLDRHGEKIVLPEDVVIADSFSADAESRTVGVDGIADGWQGLDIGPATRQRFAEVIGGARTVFWNGPMGVFEMRPFADGTRVIAEAIAGSGAFSVVGGGDSAAAVRALGIDEAGFSHISTGGGASLEFLQGATLPGLAVLENADV